LALRTFIDGTVPSIMALRSPGSPESVGRPRHRYSVDATADHGYLGTRKLDWGRKKFSPMRKENTLNTVSCVDAEQIPGCLGRSVRSDGGSMVRVLKSEMLVLISRSTVRRNKCQAAMP
jgi:hypothetical protein